MNYGVCTMHLELDTDDAVLLKRVLERVIGDLRMEVSNTESYDLRKSLQADEARLKAILDRLL